MNKLWYIQTIKILTQYKNNALLILVTKGMHSQMHHTKLKKPDLKGCLLDFLILDKRPDKTILWASGHCCL